MVLVLACAMVVTDFVRHPFTGTPPGRAASAQRALTLWTSGTDSSSGAGQLARAAARALDEPTAPAGVRKVDGGVSAAVLALLDDDIGGDDDLLVVDGGTFADLERERRDVGISDVARQAARAERLLLAAQPVALLARDTLAVAAPARSQLDSAEELLARLRTDAGSLVLGVSPDPWSVDALAAFVDDADAHGPVRYRVLPADNAAGLVDHGGIDAVVAPASELRRKGLSRVLRPLARSDGGPRATTADGAPLPLLRDLLGHGSAASLDRWVAVVAPQALRGERRTRVDQRLRRMVRRPQWAEALARRGFERPAAGDVAASGALLQKSFEQTRELVAVAARIARRSDQSRD
ncbi:hypothetical protein Q5424_17230 [Conexibacter sp. JD483]|uniref:hypothetical protein n=1 Tax=unclassified Conexibacter TaxID=2627773 RepID=UPI002717959D|nr:MULTISPECIES: hypothetical protein [unclassified Conexibacter]MDO8188670.1 hypothetical protein [Conexibacter sp. CPCC 205706]MDO8199357.1 hypothetical protein [Conexibacter sp. CPCC 205762]MDR9370843.1 hypothetical protein [Conexibacter sp. JD483]